jgi:hypothetical protein
MQSPGYFTIVTQSNSDVRIIPIGDKPRLPAKIKQWFGDSRGRWEGNTLVVETVNFYRLPPSANFLGSTEAMTLVEKFTKTGPNTMKYEYTVTDPNTWTRPWSIEAALPRVDPPIYEFACHEQNYGLMHVVRGTQIRAAEAAKRGGRPAPRAGGEGER